ncbi:unnamed protein product [Caenorhabditis nigoni]
MDLDKKLKVTDKDHHISPVEAPIQIFEEPDQRLDHRLVNQSGPTSSPQNSEQNICSDPSAKKSENPLKKKTFLTEQQKGTLNQAFAVSSIPEEDIIASLVSELQLSRTQIKQYFRMHRFKNPPKLFLGKKRSQFYWSSSGKT